MQIFEGLFYSSLFFFIGLFFGTLRLLTFSFLLFVPKKPLLLTLLEAINKIYHVWIAIHSLKALLICNLHTTQFIHFKCTMH